MKFSCSAYMPVFTLTTLSRYLGSYALPSNATMDLLLEKNTAIQIFGYALVLQGSLAGTYLTYSGLALSIGEKDPKKLAPHGKIFLLRHCVLQDKQETQK